MTELPERAKSEDRWEDDQAPAPAKPSIRALADLIEVTIGPDRVSEPAPASTPAPAAAHQTEVMPTLPPPAPPRADDRALIETRPPGPKEEAPLREVMPSNLPPTPLSMMPPTPASTLHISTIEDLVGQNQWTKICELLGAPENQGKLPVGLAFVYAVALNELRVPGGAVDQRAGDIERIMLRCLGVMLGADPKGPLTQIIAKRLMRRSWRATPAPTTRTSLIIIVAALAFGSFVGFLIGPGYDWFKSR